MGILSGIFKGKVDVDNLVTSSVSAIDKLVLTKEEKLDSHIEIAGSCAKNVESTLSESTIRSKSRRYVSQAFTTVYLLLVIAYVVVSFTTYPSFAIKEMLTDKTMNSAMIMILAFYYGGYYAPSLIESVKKKLSKRQERKKIKEEESKEE